jgi:IS30 family transposase
LVNKQPGVSHESIYQRIYADKRKGGTLHLTPRCQKIRKKRHTGRARRGCIPNQVSIDLRPAIVAERGRFSDWEADLVIGAGQKQALVIINERISRYSLMAHVPFKTAELVWNAMIAMLKPFSMCVHTLTTDNGREFAQHERIAATLDADFFFAHPYSSWERGANENMNGLIRQFFPKKWHSNSSAQRMLNWPCFVSTIDPENVSVTERHTKFLWSSYNCIIQQLHFRLESACFLCECHPSKTQTDSAKP